ncbi:flagellar motor switch protein FliG [Ancylobacter dichloromethanicus]|uniref:Flagellar motor switch protein FliG n=1 Tax=Ancylobacter dichloromethanicus TaxID=518825 RepID=A0A9W6J5A0_9HYPH|nr:flagellar motor switch protein FliG [Ancylobacter dichloromethanicus]MBS7556308.1 flagellar motor switch protein FliG [Ancylobacter dichloromethanicus]GLK70071.1 flagellar motor switch protein FliG [Ancylobacter dichloromethanicus]
MNGVATRTSRPLQGSDRVAALLMAMGRPVAARLMKHFEPEEIKAITRTIAEMRPVSTGQVELAIEEFATQFVAGAHIGGSPGDVERLLDGVLPPEQIAALMTDVLGAANHSIWDRISGVAEATIAAYILKEHPQIGALLLSKVKPSCAAKVLGHLPEEMRNGVMRRMLVFKPIVDETMHIIEHTIHEEFMVNLARNSGADTHARIADIINKMERDDMENVLASLAATRPKSAEILKGLLFTFDDIISLPPRARTALFDQVPNDRTVMALKGTSPDFREVILQSLGSRVRRMVEQELGSSEPASHRDVHEARRAITDLALEMAGRGEIELNSGNEEEAYVR